MIKHYGTPLHLYFDYFQINILIILIKNNNSDKKKILKLSKFYNLKIYYLPSDDLWLFVTTIKVTKTHVNTKITRMQVK